MADAKSVEELQKIEQHFQHLVDLLNQADQDMIEVKVANQAFGEAHHKNEAHGHSIADSIAAIERVLGEANRIHNEAMARLREAQAHAAGLEEDGSEAG